MELILRNAMVSDARALAKLNREEMGYDFPVEETGKKTAGIFGKS